MTKTILKYLFISFLLTSLISGSAQESKVKWLSIEQAMHLYEKVKKPILVDVYTDWCGYCKKMDRETFQDEEIAAYLSKNFYTVKLDAESNKPIHFMDTVYNNDYIGKKDKNGRIMTKGLHALAIMLLKGKMSYPTIVYFLPDEKIAAAVPGYKTTKTIQPYLLYFGEGVYKMNLFEAFNKGMQMKSIAD